ncbi:MAG: CoB--CoM heterodisulfide reductase subunit B [Candidatus Lokiarchaeota archaeon]|nr:CoB--CoM heterodisulfide reductase subunit B [Candidatus Lokiarchaeota archaeon]
MAKAEEYKMFQGCVIGNRIPFIEASARKVFDKLGIQTSDAAFACCPDPVGFNGTDHESWLAMGARNLTIAEDEGKNIISLCNGCFQTLKLVNEDLKHNDHEREKVNNLLKTVGREFKGTINVKHFVEVLHEVGAEKIKENVVKDLSGIKVACHTGCHYNRPSEKVKTDDPMNPVKLREIVAAAGAIPVDYGEEVLCCGTGVGNSEEEPAMQILSNKLTSAMNAGAEALIVNCPACFQQFDNNQKKAEKIDEKTFGLPVLYVTELLALAFGEDPKELGLNFHRTRLTAFLEKYGF